MTTFSIHICIANMYTRMESIALKNQRMKNIERNAYTSSTLVLELQISTSSNVGNGSAVSSIKSVSTVLRTSPKNIRVLRLMVYTKIYNIKGFSRAIIILRILIVNRCTIFQTGMQYLSASEWNRLN